ncbi:hypothetical protein RI129_004622 [Pyrocoelia pectoralis]|uniref:Uncharacterized protein n=1 Tax=Pyrocoelia pectoralis TaxID=417401 RepID=A0AAN7VJ89_9COLE
MNKLNICVFILGVISSVLAEAPLTSGPYPASVPVYQPPRIIETPAPYPPSVPAPVYGPPEEIIVPPPKIISNYDYAVYTPKRVEVLAPYAPPAPIIKTAPYAPPAPIFEYVRPAVPIISNYNYDLPKYIPAPAPVFPAPVYSQPKIIERIVPAPVYEVPEIIRSPVPVLTNYNYAVHAPQPVVLKSAPYPAPTPIVKIPETPVVPHTQYGSPLF